MIKLSVASLIFLVILCDEVSVIRSSPTHRSSIRQEESDYKYACAVRKLLTFVFLFKPFILPKRNFKKVTLHNFIIDVYQRRSQDFISDGKHFRGSASCGVRVAPPPLGRRKNFDKICKGFLKKSAKMHSFSLFSTKRNIN